MFSEGIESDQWHKMGQSNESEREFLTLAIKINLKKKNPEATLVVETITYQIREKRTFFIEISRPEIRVQNRYTSLNFENI